MAFHRLTFFALVGLLHVGLALALTRLSDSSRVAVAMQQIEAHFISEARNEPLAPRPSYDIPPVVPLRITAEMPTFEVVASPSMTSPHSVQQQSATPTAITAESQPMTIEAVEYMTPPVPRYPTLSKRLKEHGTVVLKVLVDEKGDAARIEVADSSGFERLDQAAVEAVAGATFRPHVENGAARAVFVLIPIEFGLKRAKG